MVSKIDAHPHKVVTKDYKSLCSLFKLLTKLTPYIKV